MLGYGRRTILTLLLVIATLGAGDAVAQTITRGPMIQNPDGFPTTMTISWWTNISGNSTVEYGTVPTLGLTKTVATAGSCEIGSAGLCHHVQLTGLLPGTRYYYRLLTNGVEVQTTTYFTTMKTAVDPTPLFFTVIGDWGQGSSALTDLGNRNNTADPPLIVTVGDNAYQNGTQSDWDNNALPAYRNVLRRALFMPVLGNHDLNSVGAGNWFNSIEIRMFQLPRNAPVGQEERYFSFDHGDAHFVALDSNDPLNGTQRAWLEADLAATTRRWKFVFFHHPPYSCASGLFSFGSYQDIRNNWSPLFEKYGVDVVFDGHDHIWERSKYVDQYLENGSPGSDGKGTYYIMTGGGGATLDGAASLSGGQPVRSGEQCNQWMSNTCSNGAGGQWCTFARFSYASVTLTNDQVLNIKAIDRNGVVFDDFTINRPSCGDGILDLAASEQCDEGAVNGTSASCCSATCTLKGAGTVCRPVAGVCDVEETCNGTLGSCPANTFVPNTTECRASAGMCDPAESCSGSAAACPADAKSSAPCRAATDLCDVAESCNGVGDDCPADGFAASTVPCRGSGGVCDPGELCTGTGPACPADLKSTAPCRGAGGVCDVGESCDGVDNACPPDTFLPSSTVCRGSAGVCDVAENCTGASPACPADGFASNSVVCRGAAGDCDQAETCTGAGSACPADAKSTGSCRGAAGDCDLAETCDGVSDACPADLKSTAGCRAIAGPCDVAETCDGVGNDCPADAFEPSSVVCRGGAGVCDVAENCSGTSAACPANAFQPTSVVCRASGGECDVAETCTGSTAACPSDQKSTTVCRAAAGPCDAVETCNGTADTCPPDAKSTTVCRPAAGGCDVAESCTGLGDDCPADVLHSAGAVCRVSAGVCDEPEACDGTTAPCPTDLFKPASIVCRPSSGVCDVAESCTGGAAACPADGGATDGDSDGVCDQLDRCPAVPDPAQTDGDSDGAGDACDPCTNVGPVFVVAGKLSLQKLGGVTGDDKFKFTGTFTIPTTPAIDPLTKGVRVLVNDTAGTLVLDALIPGGAYDRLARRGWTVNGSGTAWTFKHQSTTPPAPSGIYKVSFKRGKTVGQYKFSVSGKNGNYPVVTANIPVRATFVVDAPLATTGQCGEAVFPGPAKPAPTCVLDGSGANLKCR